MGDDIFTDDAELDTSQVEDLRSGEVAAAPGAGSPPVAVDSESSASSS